ncbi:hypothetical protein F52700_3770 [Fusarium sp. NRRL 52700]|nr:hypothetical protein F52700_3770 [Fusarium sp. NRRL 52700]
MNLQNLDAAIVYIICENFCRPCHARRGDHQDLPCVSAAQDADAKTLRYTLLVKSLAKFSDILSPPEAGSNIIGWERFIGALVLIQTPNLEYLETIAKDLGQILDKFGKPLSIHGNHFPQRLKTLDIKNKTAMQTRFYNPLDLSEGSIGGFISVLPNLQALEAVNPHRRTLRDPLQFHNVRHIALRSTILDKEELRTLISATGPLESFLYMGAYCFGANFCSIQDICEVLALRENTLKWIIAVPVHTAYNFTAGAQLLNVRFMRMALEDIWLPVLDDEIRDDQILVRGLPPNLETVHFDAADNILEDLLDAVITYIQSSYRKDPNDQVLRKVRILVNMYSDRQTMEQSPDSIRNSALKLIQEKCGDFLKHGKVVLRAFWDDGQDEDGGH